MKTTKPYRLLPDGAYSNDHYGGIDGYTDIGLGKKATFMAHARTLLKRAGQVLDRAGYILQRVHADPGGIAGSGDVYAYYYRPEDLAGVYCTISASSVSLGGRQDGLTLMARWSQGNAFVDPHYERRRNDQTLMKFPRDEKNGPNVWLSPAFDAVELGERLVVIAGHLDPAYRGPNLEEPTEVHTVSAGVVHLPSPVVATPLDEIKWFAGHRAVAAALEADVCQATANAEPVQMSLFAASEPA